MSVHIVNGYYYINIKFYCYLFNFEANKFVCADERTRTSTLFKAQPPQGCVYASFTTSARRVCDERLRPDLIGTSTFRRSLLFQNPLDFEPYYYLKKLKFFEEGISDR